MLSYKYNIKGVSKMYNIEIYEDKNGRSEVVEYIKSLQKKNDKDSKIKFNKIVDYIRLLREHGLSLGTPYIKHLDTEIWELRPLRDRILFAYWDNNKFILLSYFMKQTQKTPPREIEKAKKLLKDYKNRSEEK